MIIRFAKAQLKLELDLKYLGKEFIKIIAIKYHNY